MGRHPPPGLAPLHALRPQHDLPGDHRTPRAGRALRGPGGPVHGHGRAGLPRAQAVLHPDCAGVPGREAPWVVPADEAPDDVDLGAYGMRVWIEQGFRTPGAWVGSGTAPGAWPRPASTATGWSWPSPPSGCWPTVRASRRRICAVWRPAACAHRPCSRRRWPAPDRRRLSAGPGPGPAAARPRLRLGPGLAAAPPRTGSALGTAVGGPARTGANGRTLTRLPALPTPIRASGWGQLERKLAYKAGALRFVDPAYTSQACSRCGHTARSNRPSQAVFACGACGVRAHADHNAAINTLVRAGLPPVPVPARGTGAAARRGALPPWSVARPTTGTPATREPDMRGVHLRI